MVEGDVRGEQASGDMLEGVKTFLERAMLTALGAMMTLSALRLAEAPDLRAAMGWMLAAGGVLIVLWAGVARVLARRRYRERTQEGTGAPT